MAQIDDIELSMSHLVELENPQCLIWFIIILIWWQVGQVGVSACSEVSKKDIETSSKQSMVKKLVVRGGTSKTRAELTDELSKENINTLLQEGETDPSPILYTFYPLWTILKAR